LAFLKDLADLQAEDLDYIRHCFVYDRQKTGNLGGMRTDDKAWEVILRHPRTGPLFPYLTTVREADRATEFKQSCDGLVINGLTLHNYRYAWAERSAGVGYPERDAQRVPGQNSKIVHRAYARRTQRDLPSLEDCEKVHREARESGKVVVMTHESEVPKAA
jgi:hypothetical protein